jgi:serine/threonine protein kinase
MSPEVISCKAYSSFYNEKTDIWALGITAIELGDCQPPLYDVPPMRALLQIPRREPPTLASPENWSKEFNDFLATCLKKDPKQRPNSTELLKHHFLQKACTPEVVVLFIERKNRLKNEAEGGQEEGEFLEGEIGEEEQGGEVDEQALAEFLQELSKNAPEGTLLETGVAGDDDLELMDEDDINSWLQTDKTDEPAKKEEKEKEEIEQVTPTLDSAPITTRRPKPNPPTSTSTSSSAPTPPVHSMLKKKPSAGSNSKLAPTPSGAQTKRMPSLAGMNATKGGRNTSASALNRPQPTMAGFTIAGRAAFKKQASGAILKEMKKVEDHKRFLQLAKALGKLVEQHKNQHQRLLRQQQKEIQEFVVTNHLRYSVLVLVLSCSCSHTLNLL